MPFRAAASSVSTTTDSGEFDHVDQHVFIEFDAEHRRGREHFGRVSADRVDATPHDIAQARRHRGTVEAGLGPVAEQL